MLPSLSFFLSPPSVTLANCCHHNCHRRLSQMWMLAITANYLEVLFIGSKARPLSLFSLSFFSFRLPPLPPTTTTIATGHRYLYHCRSLARSRTSGPHPTLPPLPFSTLAQASKDLPMFSLLSSHLLWLGRLKTEDPRFPSQWTQVDQLWNQMGDHTSYRPTT